MAWRDDAIQATVSIFFCFVAGAMMVSCSSAPAPQSEPSKQEIRQDADRFFHKMGQEEGKPTPPSP